MKFKAAVHACRCKLNSPRVIFGIVIFLQPRIRLETGGGCENTVGISSMTRDAPSLTPSQKPVTALPSYPSHDFFWLRANSCFLVVSLSCFTFWLDF